MISPWKHYTTLNEIKDSPAPWELGKQFNAKSIPGPSDWSTRPNFCTRLAIGPNQWTSSPIGSCWRETFENYRLNRESLRSRQARLKRYSAVRKLNKSNKRLDYSSGLAKNSKRSSLPSFLGQVDQISVESITDSEELVSYFEKNLKKYMRFPKDDDKVGDEDIVPNSNEINKEKDIIEKDGLLSKELEGKAPLQLLEEAKTSSVISKVLVKCMQYKSAEELEEYAKIVNANIQEHVQNENTCYLVKHLIKVKESTMKKVYNLAANRLDEMLDKVHTCRLVYTMCNHSPRFRDLLLIAFKSKLMKLLGSLSGAILLSLLICNYDDLKHFDFIVNEMQNNPDLIKAPFFSRAFATYMNKCSQETLDLISPMLSKNLPFLLQDNYGNYLLQIFYERDCKPGIEMCNLALKKIYKKAFVRRYTRYVLLKALQHPSSSQIATELLSLLAKDPQCFESILLKKFSQELLLLALAKVKSKNQLLSMIEIIQSLKSSKLTLTSHNERLQKALITDLAILKRYARCEPTK